MKKEKGHINKSLDLKIKNSFDSIKGSAPAFNFDKLPSNIDQTLSDKITESFNNRTSSAPSFDFNKFDNTDPIFSKVTESFDNQKVNAHAFNFDALNDNPKQTHFDKVAESFNNLKSKAPEKVWNNIDRKLNLDSVWKNIVPNLTPRQFNTRRLLVSSAAAILLLFLPFNLSDSKNTQNFFANSKYIPTVQNSTDKYIIDNTTSNSSKEQIVKTKSNVIVKTANNNNNNNKSLNVAENLILEQLDITQKDIVSDQKTASKAITIQKPNIEIQPKQDYAKKLEIGIIGGMNYTRINNNDVRASKRKSSLYSSQLSLGTFYGITANYNLNSKYSISSEFLINSKSNQINSQFSGGHLNKKISQINYSKISVIFYKSLNKLQTQKGLFKIGVGPYIALNKNSISSINDNINSINSGYKKFDFGIKTKLCFEKNISNFIISHGITNEIGLLNINKGNSYVPGYLNFTSIFNIGGFIEIRYKF